MAQAEARIAELKAILEKTASGSTAYLQGCPWGSEQDHRRYMEALREYQRIAFSLPIPAPQAQQQPKAVNLFGEATSREITSTTYERAMARQRNEILRFVS